MMKLYKATFRNKSPYLEEEVELERTFYDRENAKRWLQSFGNGKYIETDIESIN